MSNSTTNLDLIAPSQYNKEVTANCMFDAASPAMLFGRRASASAGLAWGMYGGNKATVADLVQVPNSSLTLTASATNYIYEIQGTVSFTTSMPVGWPGNMTGGRIALYEVVTGPTTVTSYKDWRATNTPAITSRLVQAMANTNQTLTAAQARNQIIELTGANTALRDCVVPLTVQQWTVFSNTTGGFGNRFIGTSGTGVTVADGKRATIYCDGTNVVRATPDV